MADKVLYATATGLGGILSVNNSQSHESTTSITTINCRTCSLDVGDAIEVNIGYSDDHGKIFDGYVKRIEKITPDGIYTVTANDILVRAVDYFIVSDSPDSPYIYRNITAEELIEEVLSMAGLSSFDFGTTYFTFGINNDVEVNLVSSYDYARMICDIIVWSFWADKNGTIYLRNRKPYPMDGSSGQPGDIADSPVKTINDNSILSSDYGFSEKDLRNKIVVYGNNLTAEASSATSYDPATSSYRQILPVGFYKAAVLASPLIDDQSFAQNAADYNLQMLNRLTYEVPITIIGDHELEARQVVTINSTKASISGDWYIYQAEHMLSKAGYTTNLLLRK